jgi:MYXO-CTERM domain-containing protein
MATSTVAIAQDGTGGGDSGPVTPPPSDPPEDGDPPPGSDSGLSDTETSYKGAIMLRAGQELTMETVVPGYVGDESYQADGRYAYFSGNTLYAGVQDDQGNYVDMIAEFFWFESSLDRGSDFYVGVVKARTSPNLKDWVLDRKGNDFVGAFVPDDEATLYLRAQTDVSHGEFAFRWDWSIPFDNYGWDAFGNITMETAYGLSVNAEGSAQKAFDANVQGVPVEANVQAKGYFNKSYQVQTKYEVTLYRWEIIVHGGAGQIDWQLLLHSGDRERQNAYHEYFIVMQADQGVPFRLDWLEVGGSVKNPKWYWFDEHRPLSAAVTGIVLRPPQLPPPPPSNDGTDEPEAAEDDPEAPLAPPSDPIGEGESETRTYYAEGCDVSGRDAGAGWLALVGLGLFGGLRRRRES